MSQTLLLYLSGKNFAPFVPSQLTDCQKNRESVIGVFLSALRVPATTDKSSNFATETIITMKQKKFLALAFLGLLGLTESPAQNHTNDSLMEKLTLTTEWDKTFPQSDKVSHCKVTFCNRYGITLAADLYKPKGATGPLPAIAVSGPFGAVKEQASGLYAQTLAERGFLTLAFDPSFTGESGGQPRSVASPDINTEDFSAAVDYLSTRDDVDPARIGILGICGFGGFALNAAAMDTRVKATVASTMYDICRNSANGYFDANNNADARYAMRQQLNAQRTEDYRNGTSKRTVMNPKPAADAPQFMKDYYDYYKTKRGYHPPLHQLRPGLERHLDALVHQHAHPGVCRRNTQRRPDCTRRKGPLPLLRRGCLQETEGRQQAAADCAGRQPHRPLRQHEKNPV